MRGQTGINSGVLIILVTIALVLYILMLPADIRDDLLNDEGYSGSTDGSGSGVAGRSTILDVSPGRVDVTNIRDRTHAIPSFKIQLSKEPTIIKSADSVTVVNSAFSKDAKTLSFDIDPESTSKLLLTFNVLEADGALIVSFNGEEILNRELTQGSVDPIVLQTDSYDNTLTFFTSSPGWLLFGKNKYVLSNVRVSGEITDFSGSEATQTFSLTPDEYNGMSKAKLSYKPICNPSAVGTMNVWLNGNTVFQGVPDCGYLTNIDVAKELLNEGNNQLYFASDKGSYIIDQGKLVTESTSVGSPSFFFDLDKKYFDDDNDLKSGYNIILELYFTDNDGTKSGTIEVNGDDFSFRTSGARVQRRIDAYVERGTNEIEINGKDLDIARMRVLIED